MAALAPKRVLLLENLRFHPGETKNDPGFAAQLAALADAYVDDAFGSAHRAHASVVGIVERLQRKAAGRLMEREVAALGRLLGEPQRPFAALLGGAKIEGKIDTLSNLLPRLDLLLVGGGMANTFLAAQGHDMAARRIETIAADQVPAGMKAVDIGPASRHRFAAAISSARTLFWNGPMGVFERPPFDAGTRELAQALAACPGFSVIGGGETVAAARQAGVIGRIGHVSTGGGAALEFLAGKTLPGVAVLERRP